MKNIKINSMVLMTLMVATLYSCGVKSSDSSNAKPKSIAFNIPKDIYGTYVGTLPCADCSGIATTITIADDLTFSLTEIYEDLQTTIDTKGSASIDKATQTVTLVGNDSTTRVYLAKNGQLCMLDAEGNMPSGELKDEYTLEKLDKNICTLTVWSLSSLNGKEVKSEATLKIDPFKNRVSGGLGCNTFFSKSKLGKNNSIKIESVNSTMMMCDPESMKIEQEYSKILKMAKRYSTTDKTLTLYNNENSEIATFSKTKN